MKVTVQIVVDAQDGTPPAVEQVAVIARDDLTIASAGLALAEAHEVLSGIQHRLLTAQAATVTAAERDCASCGRPRGRKDTRHIVLRTMFGTLRLESPRYKAVPVRRRRPVDRQPAGGPAARADHARTAAAGGEVRGADFRRRRRHAAERVLPARPRPAAHCGPPTGRRHCGAAGRRARRGTVQLHRHLPRRVGGTAPPGPAAGCHPGRRLRPLQPEATGTGSVRQFLAALSRTSIGAPETYAARANASARRVADILDRATEPSSKP